MLEPVAYLNGYFIPASNTVLSVADAGFVLGAAASEQLRTFRGRLFRLEDHLDRLERSMQVIGVDSGLNRRQWTDIAEELIQRNQQFLTPGDDWGLTIFVTPGIYRSYAQGEQTRPTVCLHVYPLPFHLWADQYRTGAALAVTPIRQVPRQCWPTELKCRSRMHYYLADKLASNQEPGARAVLLDQEGCVAETSTANVLIYKDQEGLISPPLEKILHGISLAVTFEIAEQLHIPHIYRDITPEELAAADEIIITSTPMCLLPATRLSGKAVGNDRPGEIFGRLLTAWNEIAGMDIVDQACRFIRR